MSPGTARGRGRGKHSRRPWFFVRPWAPSALALGWQSQDVGGGLWSEANAPVQRGPNGGQTGVKRHRRRLQARRSGTDGGPSICHRLWPGCTPRVSRLHPCHGDKPLSCDRCLRGLWRGLGLPWLARYRVLAPASSLGARGEGLSLVCGGLAVPAAVGLVPGSGALLSCPGLLPALALSWGRFWRLLLSVYFPGGWGGVIWQWVSYG